MKWNKLFPGHHFFWLYLPVIISVFVAAELETTSSCPDSCVCTGNSSILCQNINSQRWPDLCKDIKLLSSGDHMLQDMQLKGEVLNSTLLELDLGCLPSSRSLGVSFIMLKRSPTDLKNVYASEMLSVTYSGIQHLPENVFSSLGSVQSLNLSHNDICDLEPKAFFGLYSLQTLDLSFNNIRYILPAIFQSLTNLTYLDLGHNKIDQFTSWHLPPSSNLQILLLNGNNLKSFYVGENASDSTSLNHVQSLDISNNPLECSCVLQKVLNKIVVQGGVISNAGDTLCHSPTPIANMTVVKLNETDLKCSNPHSLMSFPSEMMSVLYTDTVTLECHAEAYPSPHIMWITPWGEKFSTAPMSLITLKNLAEQDQINFFREYEERNVMMTSSIKVTDRNDLVISHFRGSMSGNFSCIAFNEVGSKTKVIHLTVHSRIKSTYVTSLIFASYCASGCLIVGFIVGFINILIRKLRHKVSFKVPLFTPAVSVRPATIEAPPSTYSDLSPPTSPLLVSSSERSLDISTTVYDYSGEELSPEKRPHHILDSIGDAREKLRDGVGRKMETVRRNVQSIKESTGNAVHTIMESGSSAANKMKAGVVMGVETVKSHVQSVKELCGTGNMGAHTVSIISMETDIDTNEQKSLVRQVTVV